jgi:hypothetical protein
LWRLTQQSAVSVDNAWTATKLVHIRPYKITVTPEMKPVDYEEERRFVTGLTIMCMTDLLILS